MKNLSPSGLRIAGAGQRPDWIARLSMSRTSFAMKTIKVAGIVGAFLDITDERAGKEMKRLT